MTNCIFHVAEDGGNHEGALDHDVQMIIENEIFGFLSNYGVHQDEAIASIKRVIKDIELGN